MKSLILFFVSILFSSSIGDIMISDTVNDIHLIVDEDLTMIRKFDFKMAGRLDRLKARNTEDGLVLYYLKSNEITTHIVSSDGKVSDSVPITINKNDVINAFDVQPSGELIVMSSGNKIYLFSKKENRATQVLETSSRVDLVYIHPTERIIYFANCSANLGTFLTVYNIDRNISKHHRVRSCSVTIDFKENIIWDTGNSRITKINMETKTSEDITSIPTDIYATSDLSSDHLFLMRLRKGKDIFKLTTSPKLQKQMNFVHGFRPAPVLSYLFGRIKFSNNLMCFADNGNFVGLACNEPRCDLIPVLINTDEPFIDVLEFNFERKILKIGIEVYVRPIRTVKTIHDDRSTTFFWIYERNDGEVVYNKVVGNDVEKTGTFQVPTNGANIVDFDIQKGTNVFYFATHRTIIKNKFDILALNLIKEFQTFNPRFKSSIKALGIHQSQSKLIVSYCDKDESGLAMTQIDSDFEDIKTLEYAPQCSERILVDEKANRMLVSSRTGVYNVGFDDEIEQIYHLKDIKNFVLHEDHVYFVSKIDGPGIYKIDKRRIKKIDHNLPLADNGNFVIARIKDLHTKNKTTDVQSLSTQSTNLEKECTTAKPKSESMGSEMTPSAEIILLLSIQVAIQIVM